MNIDLSRKYITVVLVAMLLSIAFTCEAGKKPSPVPDLTAGGVKDDLHDWNLGPTGARGWI